MQYSKKQREEYNRSRALTCANLGITESQYNWFRRIGNQLHSIYEDSCNGLIQYSENKPAEAGSYEALTNPLYEKAEAKAKSLNLYIYFQTDPRGATIYLDREPIAENAYNRASCIW